METITLEDAFCVIGICIALWCILFVWRHGGPR
jgi:hypothetical protein